MTAGCADDEVAWDNVYKNKKHCGDFSFVCLERQNVNFLNWIRVTDVNPLICIKAPANIFFKKTLFL